MKDRIPPPTVFAIHAHPDDIEFNMAGTLLLLRQCGCRLHYMNISDGCYGSYSMDKQQTAEVRAEEGRSAAAWLGAEWHPNLCSDMAILYTEETLRRLAAIFRAAKPNILLVASPEDYMEDHINACRLSVSAAFVLGIPNYETIPPMPFVEQDVAIYHTLPHGLHDAMRTPIRPDFYIDINAVIEEKATMLAFHRSQQEWLLRSQGFDDYIETMRRISAQLGEWCGKKCRYAEGWRMHNHIGFASQSIDPLGDLLDTWVIPAK